MNRRQFVGTAAALVGSTLAGCATAPPSPDFFRAGASGASSVDNEHLGSWLDAQSTGDLSTTEVEDLFWMREEEKLARDVYLVLYDEWGLQVHDNVAEAEQTHMDAMLQLVDRYGLEDPATDTVGTFTNDQLQALYDDLVPWGEQSVLDSLEVGCRIEETDIKDIQVRIDRTDERAIQLVYENLMKGSRNHLRAYYRVLTQRGGDYEPVVIDQATFDDIVSSDWESGRP